MDSVPEINPANRESTGRNSDGTFMKGISGNPSGRPKNTMKDYLRRKFMEMTDSEKEEFLRKVSPEIQIRLAEGNPAQDLTSGGEKIQIIPIYGGESLQEHNSDEESVQDEKED